MTFHWIHTLNLSFASDDYVGEDVTLNDSIQTGRFIRNPKSVLQLGVFW